MDIRYKDEFEFLDLSDLDDIGREEVATALSSADVLQLPWDTGETDCSSESSEAMPAEAHHHWERYEIEENSMKYDGRQETSSMVMPVLPQAHIYPHPIITTMYGGMASVYVNNNATANVSVHPGFMPGMAYSQTVYAPSPEVHALPSIRPSCRRGNRARGIKRESYSRSGEPPAYMTSQSQYHQVPRNVYQCPPIYYSPDHVPPAQQQQQQQQPPSGIYMQPENMYSSHSHVVYPQMCSHSPSGPHFARQLQPAQSYQVQEQQPKDCAVEPCEKRTQSGFAGAEPSYRQRSGESQKAAPQTNIVTTVIVNNGEPEEREAPVAPVNVKIEHNIVSTRTSLVPTEKTCRASERSEAPRVNINSSVEVKRKLVESEERESVKTTVVKTLTTPPVAQPRATVKPSKPSQEVVQVEAMGEASTTPPSGKSWASLLKKGPSEPVLTPLSSKPTARINPLNVSVPVEDAQPKAPVQSVAEGQQASAAPAKVLPSEHAVEIVPQQPEVPHYNYDDPVTYRMGEFFLQYQMDKQTVSLLPRGLTNRNNYCYINSILQALLACPPFYNLLMAIPDPRNPSKNSSTPLIDNMIKFVREFTPLSAGARLARKDLRAQRRSEDAVVDVQSGVAFEPSYVYTMLKNTSCAGVFSVEGRQEDAEEFLSCLLNGISDEMLEVMKLVNNEESTTGSMDAGLVNNSQGDHEEWKVMGPKNKGSITRCTEFGRTPLSDIFRGQLRSKVSRAGEQSTDNVQPFFTLQLDIEKAESVEGALEILVGKDPLEGMTCSKTKQEIEAWKQVYLEELPVILILHLKWFDYKLDGCSKIVKSVSFPIDLKIESKFLSPSAAKKFLFKQRQYKLFAVTYHDGKEATKGHYVTDAFHVGYGGWVRYDDSSLKGISETNVLNPSPPRVPYLLYYRRCDTIGNSHPSSNKTR